MRTLIHLITFIYDSNLDGLHHSSTGIDLGRTMMGPPGTPMLLHRYYRPTSLLKQIHRSRCLIWFIWWGSLDGETVKLDEAIGSPLSRLAPILSTSLQRSWCIFVNGQQVLNRGSASSKSFDKECLCLWGKCSSFKKEVSSKINVHY
jgi:hypothetical protein